MKEGVDDGLQLLRGSLDRGAGEELLEHEDASDHLLLAAAGISLGAANSKTRSRLILCSTIGSSAGSGAERANGAPLRWVQGGRPRGR